MIAKKLQLDNVQVAQPTPLRPQPTRPVLAHSQNSEIDFPPATFRSRAIAMFIDSTLTQVFTNLMVSTVTFIDPELLAGDETGLLIGMNILITFSSMFFVICVPMMFTQQSLGKKLMGLKVISLRPGGELETGQIMKREMVSKGFSTLFFGIGFLMALWDKDKRAWHDKNSDTRVVSIR